MRKLSLLRPAVAAAALLALAACADAPTSAPRPAAPRLGLGGFGSVDTAYTTFKIAPASTNTYTIGGSHRVQIVANSVCDPATTSYGPTEWDKPCQLATETITITAKSWTDALGHPRVEFSPDLRFSPDKSNTIWVLDKSAASDPLFKIVWCPTGSLTCVNEGLLDPSVATQYDAKNGFLYRRVKHFSGYTVTAD